MPNLGEFHPQVVHFVIGLLYVGVLFRVLSLFGRWTWTSAAATTLIVFGALASYAAVKTGTDAHGPVERVPGARTAVQEHEEWGKRTRNLFLAVAALEVVGLALAPARRRYVHLATAVVGLGGLVSVYETGEHGGELVYSYAGGVGIRTGDTADVSRLLLAGLYQQAMLDRREGQLNDAGMLFDQLRQRFPNDTSIRVLAIESLLRDRQDAPAARAALDELGTPANPRLKRTLDLLKVDILAAAGQRDSARTVLEALMQGGPPNPRLQAKLDSLK